MRSKQTIVGDGMRWKSKTQCLDIANPTKERLRPIKNLSALFRSDLFTSPAFFSLHPTIHSQRVHRLRVRWNIDLFLHSTSQQTNKYIVGVSYQQHKMLHATLNFFLCIHDTRFNSPAVNLSHKLGKWTTAVFSLGRVYGIRTRLACMLNKQVAAGATKKSKPITGIHEVNTMCMLYL